MDMKAFYSLSCGLYLVSALHREKAYGCVVNTVTQVTAEPAKLMVAINKKTPPQPRCWKAGALRPLCCARRRPWS